MTALYLLVLFVLGAISSPLRLKDSSTELKFDSIDDTFRFRHLEAGSVSVPWVGVNAVWYHSVETDVSTKKPLDLTGDYIWGSIYTIGKSCPVNWQLYYNANLSVDRTIDNKTTLYDWNAQFGSSYVVASYLSLIEKNTTGAIVQKEKLAVLWTYNQSQSNSLTNKTEGLYAFVYDAPLSGGASMQLQYVLTQQGGDLDVLDGVRVAPKGVETIVFINNWRYQSKDNTLSLQIAVGSANLYSSTNGQVVGGSGVNDTVYFRVATNAQIDGSMDRTKVSFELASDLEVFSLGVRAQLYQKYKSDAKAGIFTVEFPAGAQNIVYDPSLGSGEDPFEEKRNIGLIIGVTIACFVAFVLILASVVYFRRRSQYHSL